MAGVSRVVVARGTIIRPAKNLVTIVETRSSTKFQRSPALSINTLPIPSFSTLLFPSSSIFHPDPNIFILLFSFAPVPSRLKSNRFVPNSWDRRSKNFDTLLEISFETLSPSKIKFVGRSSLREFNYLYSIDPSARNKPRSVPTIVTHVGRRQ